VNSPYGDPGLYVQLRWQGRALLFDLGRLGRLDPGALLKISDVFISHAHMDHFIGFDHLLRIFLARDATLRLFGPTGIIDNVRGKLAGYTWNLVDDYAFRFEVTEVTSHERRTVALPAATGFAPVALGTHSVDASEPIRLVDEPDLSIDTTVLDHKIPCLAFVAAEPNHLNVDRDALQRLGLTPGAWLNQLKTAIRAESPPDTLVAVAPGRVMTVAALRAELIVETPGQRIAYVTDTRFSPENIARILRLARGVDLLVCEAPFLEEEHERAAARAHLTARQAGALARWAGARHLKLFHFSPRHDGAGDLLRREAEDEFLGRDIRYDDGPERLAAASS
jgi:ribonuclease Z